MLCRGFHASLPLLTHHFPGPQESLGDHPRTLAPGLSISPAPSGNASSLKEKMCLFVVVVVVVFPTAYGILVP